MLLVRTPFGPLWAFYLTLSLLIQPEALIYTKIIVVIKHTLNNPIIIKNQLQSSQSYSNANILINYKSQLFI